MSLQQKTISGIFWTFSQQFSVQLINFIVQIVLARLLLPSEFGLIAMLTVFIGIGNSLMDSGLTTSLIRTGEPDQRDYSTVFFMNLIGSAVVYAILFLTAPFIALFYKQDLLTNIIRVYMISIIIRGFVGVQTARLTKEMNFRIQMLMQIPSVIIGGIVGIVLARAGYGVWSLVWMELTQSFLFTIQHWFRTGWYPEWIIDKEKLKHHFKFGYKITLSGLLNTLFNNIYNLVIGKYFSATQLGFYNRADMIRMLPVQNVSTALNKVTYPMFAAIQNDNVKLKMAYKKLMLQVIFWITPAMIFLGIIAEPLFRFLLTEKWLPIVPYFRILCVSAALYPLQVYNLNILYVKGRSDLFLRLEIIKKIIIALGILCSLPFGIYGLLYVQIVISVISFYINTFYSGRMIDYSIKEQVRDIIPTFVLAIAIGFIAYYLDHFAVSYLRANDIFRIAGIGLAYLGIYLCAGYYLRMPAITDFRQLILKK
ncbi:lipopolysaccharide biosynthesis protein [Chitinophaga sp. RAB17]|uniref:lipopolysaccharide biosynthesis protein n=1 Tax=Chitinophaga sp. RAB17 TaxID=3233049 RepID=UPI003F909F03